MIQGAEQEWQLAPRRTFARLALDCLFARRNLLPLAFLLVLVVGSGVAALLYPPLPGAAPPAFIAAAALRAIAVCYLSAVILRGAVASTRPVWLPDGGFWLFLLPFAISLALPLLIARCVNGLAWLPAQLIAEAASVLLVSLAAPTIVSLVAERPPMVRFQPFSSWLPQRIGLGLLLLVPLALLHLWLSSLPFIDARWFWPAAIGEGLVYFLLLTFRLGLDAAAYWRVAQG